MTRRTLIGWTRTCPRPFCRSVSPRPGATEPVGDQVPVALAWGQDRAAERRLAATPRQVATVDPKLGRVVGRRDLPFRPASLAYLDDRTTLLVGGTDGEFLALGAGGETVLSLSAGRGPTRVVALGGGRAAAATTWDASVWEIDVAGRKAVKRTPIAFPVGALVAGRDGRVIAADAFGWPTRRRSTGRRAACGTA